MREIERPVVWGRTLSLFGLGPSDTDSVLMVSPAPLPLPWQGPLPLPRPLPPCSAPFPRAARCPCPPFLPLWSSSRDDSPVLTDYCQFWAMESNFAYFGWWMVTSHATIATNNAWWMRSSVDPLMYFTNDYTKRWPHESSHLWFRLVLMLMMLNVFCLTSLPSSPSVLITSMRVWSSTYDKVKNGENF